MSKAAALGVDTDTGRGAGEVENQQDQQAQQDPAQRGTLNVRTIAIQHVAEHVASQVPGTVAHSAGLGKLLRQGYPSAQVDVRGSSTWIRLQVAVVWPTVIEEVAARAREEVREQTTRLCGSNVRRVDVTVHLVAADQVQATSRRVA